ncbi:hypothetical protein SD72_06240 [Leucobacter komagatae]|uniref:Uncharacterized protein n=1 Tax=Leucobacter komagatae TaxID=55969 RepID=A0A0D0H6K1_9MICO|nr:hypothetical protein SD72_06240 [Leucobacter komagatae]
MAAAATLKSTRARSMPEREFAHRASSWVTVMRSSITNRKTIDPSVYVQVAFTPAKGAAVFGWAAISVSIGPLLRELIPSAVRSGNV